MNNKFLRYTKKWLAWPEWPWETYPFMSKYRSGFSAFFFEGREKGACKGKWSNLLAGCYKAQARRRVFLAFRFFFPLFSLPLLTAYGSRSSKALFCVSDPINKMYAYASQWPLSIGTGSRLSALDEHCSVLLSRPASIICEEWRQVGEV